jgi:hypothetical protein
MRISARQQVLRRPLSEATLAKSLRSMLPSRNGYCPVNYPELLGELRFFGILTSRQLRQLILRHRREAIEIDAQPLDTLNAKIYRKELGDEEFLFLARRRMFFGWEGLVRVILELEFGDRYRAYAEKRDHRPRKISANIQAEKL